MSFTFSAQSQDLVGKLAANARNYGLVLVVGSGINGTAAPQWSELLDELFAQAVQKAGLEDKRIANFPKKLKAWCGREFDSLAQASIVKELLGPERYRLEIQHAIYRRIKRMDDLQDYCCKPNAKNKGKCGNYELLRKVAELCQLDEVKAVATFNFDVFLEVAIQACGDRKHARGKAPISYSGRVWSWADNDLKINKKTLPVYHVHGLLPPPSSALKSPQLEIVMSYDEYFDRNADPFSWETSSLVHLLRHYCILWVGVSLRDWNMLRLLHAALGDRSRLHSYCLQALPSAEAQVKCKDCKICGECKRRENCKKCAKCEKCRELTAEEEEPFKQVAMRFRAELFRAVGVRLIIGGENHKDIPKTIQLIQRAIKNKGLRSTFEKD